MASIVKKCRHGRSEWEQCRCQWYVRERVSGRDVYTPAGIDHRKALAALARKQDGGEETVSAALDTWLESKRREPGARPNSLYTYESRIRRVRARLGPNLVRSLRPIDLTNFVDSLLSEGFSPVYTKAIYNVLTATLRHAQRRGVIATVPIPPQGPGIPNRTERAHDLTLTDVEAIIGRLTGTWKVVAELILLTGLRWGEVMGLHPDDVGRGVLHVRRTRNRYGSFNPPKTKHGVRIIPLSKRAQQLVGELDLPVVGDYSVSQNALVAAMGPLHRKGMGWHSIRNAHASLLDAAGVTLRDQAARMGHGANYGQTLAYGISQAGEAKVLDEARQRASSPASEGPGRDELAARRARRERRIRGV